MQHQISLQQYGPHGESMADAIQKCVHCGFCLPSCPTYRDLGEEMDSPRGRIFLIKEVLEGNLTVDDAAPYIDRCLGCVACETSCPSGVPYGQLLTPYRAMSEKTRSRTWSDRLFRKFILNVLPYPDRLCWALRGGSMAKRLRFLLPQRMRQMLDLLPERGTATVSEPPAQLHAGEVRARVALLSGCAQKLLAPEIHAATLRVLARNGVEVVVPEQQVCCGALAAHTGDLDLAKRFARRNIEAFPTDIDAIITNAAGCGSGMHEYGLWLQGEAEEAAGREFAGRVCDISKFLFQIGFKTPPAYPRPLSVAYHDACHLAHAQKVRSEPRALLNSIENIELVPIRDADICCGSAGTYNIEQPEIAKRLGAAKAQAVQQTGADVVVTGNIGCMMQLQSHLENPIPVLHTIQLLDACYRRQEIVSPKSPPTDR
jgi:glycolate oxidase iron-sulfur subunit